MMKPRIEVKLDVAPAELSRFLRWLSEDGARPLHGDRLVHSIYFDTEGLDMYRSTLEGVTPRWKMRLRCYGEHNATCLDRHLLEVKESGPHGRRKRSQEVSDWKMLVDNGMRFPKHGWCRPVVAISYVRSYYQAHDVRITVDRHLKYVRAGVTSKAPLTRWDAAIAVEIKAPAEHSLDRLAEQFPVPRTKFSKYERAVQSLFPQVPR